MSGFYSNLLSKNIAMGGSMDGAVSAYTAGSNRNAKLSEASVVEPERAKQSEQHIDIDVSAVASAELDTELSLGKERLQPPAEVIIFPHAAVESKASYILYLPILIRRVTWQRCRWTKLRRKSSTNMK
jgi:hypothetical protein